MHARVFERRLLTMSQLIAVRFMLLSTITHAAKIYDYDPGIYQTVPPPSHDNQSVGNCDTRRGVTMTIVATAFLITLLIACRRRELRRPTSSQVNMGTLARNPAFVYKMIMKFAFPSDNFDFDHAVVVVGKVISAIGGTYLNSHHRLRLDGSERTFSGAAPHCRSQCVADRNHY